jgi:GEVED domain/Secretion system C-terminal sorting domain
MKKVLPKVCLSFISKLQLILFFIAMNTHISYSQCIAGSNTANLNWDNLDYLITTGSYSGYVTAAMSQTQAFAIGVNRVQIVYPGTITTTGENTTHTGEAGSFGTGADVQYAGNGNITLTFDNEVNNLQFSLYDIDNSQKVNVSAINTSAVPLNILMTKPAGGTVAITGSGTINAQGLAPAGATAATSNLATVNIVITGPVKTVTIAMSGTAGDFWLSDLTACVVGTFPVNYFIGSQPFTGQPTYVIGTSDTNTVSLINTSTGKAKMIFQDATSPRYINGIAFDHLQYNLYYVIDFTVNPAINKTIKRYNFDTEIMSVLVPDVNTLGIPTYSRGVESAGCAFYDNDLYFGVEGNISGNSGGRETAIWRIEFDVPGGNAIKACQVYATPSDDGAGTVLHDWNDFTIADGLLVDFAGAPTVAARRFTHYDLQTQTITNNYYTGGLTPRQAGITWNNTRYWVYDNIAVYNMNGTIGPLTAITGATVLDWKGFCGDATGFRPKSDFGDAPASYDPIALSPALHEKDTTLFMGQVFATDWDQEFNKLTSADATGDGDDDNDGLTFLSVFDPSTNQYLAKAQVYNHTGANARVIAWLDYNGNGVFDASEALTPITVPSSTAVQSVNLFWPVISSSLASGTYTFLRVRLTSAANGMTSSNATGYFNNGEVEDYRVFIDDFPLSVSLLSFEVNTVDNTATKLSWTTLGETTTPGFDIERSRDGINWEAIGFVSAKGSVGSETHDYIFNDVQALKGKSFYRLKFINANGTTRYSEIRSVTISDTKELVLITPNPAKNNTTITINSNTNMEARIVIRDMLGGEVRKEKIQLLAGGNTLILNNLDKLNDGAYIVQVILGDNIISRKLIISK